MKLTQSIYGKMIVNTILFLVMPFLIVTAFLLFQLSSDVVKNYESMVDMSVEQARSNRKLHFDNVHELSGRISSNNILKGFLLVPYTNRNLQYYRTQIAPIVASDVVETYNYSVRIFAVNQTISRGFGSFYHLDDLRGEEAAEFIKSDKNDTWVLPNAHRGYDSYYMKFADQYTYLKKIIVNDELLYLLAISVPEDMMDSFSKQNSSDTAGVLEAPVLHSLDQDRILIVNYSSTALNPAEDTWVDNDGTLQLTTALILRAVELNAFPQDLYLAYPPNPQLNRLYIIYFIAVIFIIALSFFVISYIKRIFITMYDYLRAFDESSANGYQLKLDVVGNDELSRLARAFNAQIDKIQQLLQLTAEQATVVKESQLKALYQQINPHFLYNTFETFSYRMELHELYEEADAMVSFSNMLRYNMSGKEAFSTLRMELAQVDDFMNIQQLKYKDISFDVNVPLNLYDMGLPRFILQPIIENCYTHGYYNQAMFIMLNVWESDGYVNFEVFDNGRGISAEEMAKINEALDSGRDKARVGIGLSNINTRLKLFYSDDCKIQIHSKEFSWTILNWKIPLMRSTSEPTYRGIYE